MAAPAAKKRKTQSASTTPPSPIVFQSPGLQPDVRLMVFDTEFHVHSVVLKLHSAFFRKFLDSPNKATPAADAVNPCIVSQALTTPTKFKYEWTTRFEDTVNSEDADSEKAISWYLIAGASKGSIDVSAFKGSFEDELKAFEKLVRAIYVEPYMIENYRELETMTALADYYCALPILSHTLDGALLKSRSLANGIRYNCQDALVLSTKLHNALLFRESLIWVVGHWDAWRPASIEDRTLRKIAVNARNAIADQIVSVQEDLLYQLASDDGSSISDTVKDAARDTLNTKSLYTIPRTAPVFSLKI